MASMEERAATITVEVIANVLQVIEHKDAETINGIKKYIVRELEHQRKIDIEKACEALDKFLEKYFNTWIDNDTKNEFRKIMEE